MRPGNYIIYCNQLWTIVNMTKDTLDIFSHEPNPQTLQYMRTTIMRDNPNISGYMTNKPVLIDLICEYDKINDFNEKDLPYIKESIKRSLLTKLAEYLSEYLNEQTQDTPERYFHRIQLIIQPIKPPK